MIALCAWCDEPFEQRPVKGHPQRQVRYCSDQCRFARRKAAGFARGVTGGVTEVWRHVAEPTPTDDYRYVCDLCSHGTMLRLSASDVRLLPSQRCPRPHCGGRLFLEPESYVMKPATRPAVGLKHATDWSEVA